MHVSSLPSTYTIYKAKSSLTNLENSASQDLHILRFVAQNSMKQLANDLNALHKLIPMVHAKTYILNKYITIFT